MLERLQVPATHIHVWNDIEIIQFICMFDSLLVLLALCCVAAKQLAEIEKVINRFDYESLSSRA